MVAAVSYPHARYIPTIDERVEMHLEDGTHELYICLNAWALRRRVTNKQTGEVRRTRCNLWSCRHCGPRKVDEWRQLIAEAGPTLHLVLTKAGKTVEEAARALTTFMQALRRGSKGRGKSHVGMRVAYPVEYFGVLERHNNFEENGFHWHLLLRGVDRIPYDLIKDLWRSATHGQAENGWIQRIENVRAIGYVTKYLMKDIFRHEHGTKHTVREVVGLRRGESGVMIEDRQLVEEEEASHARRIRYSRGFFPMSVLLLRKHLFTPADPNGGLSQAEEGEEGQGEHAASAWELREICPMVTSAEGYKKLLHYTLKEEITDRVINERHLSRRVVTVWNYHREMLSGE